MNAYTEEDYEKAIEFYDKGIGPKKISEKLQVSYYTIKGWIYYGHKPNGWTNEEIKFLKEKYSDTRSRKIAEELGRTEKAVNDKANKLGLKINRSKMVSGEKNPAYGTSMSEENKRKLTEANQNEEIGLTNEQRSIIWGCLLGDGSLTKRDRGNPNFRYSSAEKEMIDHLQNLFPKGFFNDRWVQDSGWNEDSPTHNIRSRCLPDLQEFKRIYCNGEKRIPNIDFNPTIFLYWYLGDGTTSDRHMHLTSRFPKEDYIPVINYLDNKGIASSWVPENNEKGKLAIYGENRKEFLKLIGEPLVSCYKYKWE